MRRAPGRGYHPSMNGVSVLVACELESYGESLAAAFRVLRPDVEVFEAEGEHLDQEVGCLGSDLAVCSRLTAQAEWCAPIRVELYAGYGPRSVVGAPGERSTIEEIQLSDLLSVTDRT